jgi:hypothetical protein
MTRAGSAFSCSRKPFIIINESIPVGTTCLTQIGLLGRSLGKSCRSIGELFLLQRVDMLENFRRRYFTCLFTGTGGAAAPALRFPCFPYTAENSSHQIGGSQSDYYNDQRCFHDQSFLRIRVISPPGTPILPTLMPGVC